VRPGGPAPVLAVVGLRAEARIAAGDGVVTLAGGGDAARLASALAERLRDGVAAVISFGIAGGLAPDLPAGTVVVADAVHDGVVRWPVDAAWRASLLVALPGAISGGLSGVDRAAATLDEKAHLRGRDGTVAVDMESHVAARFADRHRVPFAALRVVADPAERTIPAAALVGMRPDGTTDVGAVIRALARQPGDLPALIRTARDAQAAFRALRACRGRIGPTLGCVASDEIVLPR
jgi:adenosylhomocysteine nucleosidase